MEREEHSAAMLKQILADMYVDPELLAELSEEQKQILFFKMRQEQIRRWKEREVPVTSPQPAVKKVHGKSVQWKLGADGDVWVWVMGEHSLDKPYDQLCSDLLAEKVKQQSLQEAGAKRLVWLSKHSEQYLKIWRNRSGWLVFPDRRRDQALTSTNWEPLGSDERFCKPCLPFEDLPLSIYAV
nr:SH2 domain-containing protein 4A-like isoform X1 [Zootoca vivipara]